MENTLFDMLRVARLFAPYMLVGVLITVVGVSLLAWLGIVPGLPNRFQAPWVRPQTRDPQNSE